MHVCMHVHGVYCGDYEDIWVLETIAFVWVHLQSTGHCIECLILFVCWCVLVVQLAPDGGSVLHLCPPLFYFMSSASLYHHHCASCGSRAREIVFMPCMCMRRYRPWRWNELASI